MLVDILVLIFVLWKEELRVCDKDVMIISPCDTLTNRICSLSHYFDLKSEMCLLKVAIKYKFAWQSYYKASIL